MSVIDDKQFQQLLRIMVWCTTFASTKGSFVSPNERRTFATETTLKVFNNK